MRTLGMVCGVSKGFRVDGDHSRVPWPIGEDASQGRGARGIRWVPSVRAGSLPEREQDASLPG